MTSISTVIITLNEEENIERCLKSVAPISAEIILVDSGSTDRTVEIARRYTDRIFQQEWLGYGRQKQYAVSRATNNWVLSIDADEEVSEPLRDEILQLDLSKDGYQVPRKVRYLNRWITHGGWYPGYVLRLFRKDRAAFNEKMVHESVEIQGSVANLGNPLYHYSYRSMEHHLAKMNHFTSLSAQQMNRDGKRAGFGKLLFAPPIEFFKVYLLKRGFLDGYAGLIVAVLHAFYVFLKYAKLFELPAKSEMDRSRRLDDSLSGRDSGKVAS